LSLVGFVDSPQEEFLVGEAVKLTCFPTGRDGVIPYHQDIAATLEVGRDVHAFGIVRWVYTPLLKIGNCLYCMAQSIAFVQPHAPGVMRTKGLRK
jgi:hypothetical protein